MFAALQHHRPVLRQDRWVLRALLKDGAVLEAGPMRDLVAVGVAVMLFLF